MKGKRGKRVVKAIRLRMSAFARDIDETNVLWLFMSVKVSRV